MSERRETYLQWRNRMFEEHPGCRVDAIMWGSKVAGAAAFTADGMTKLDYWPDGSQTAPTPKAPS